MAGDWMVKGGGGGSLGLGAVADVTFHPLRSCDMGRAVGHTRVSRLVNVSWSADDMQRMAERKCEEVHGPV